MTTREEWLNQAAELLRPLFADTGASLPDKLHVPVGWPSHRALSNKKRVIGQCWAPECREGGFTEIFISPFLGEAFQAIDTLLHEMVHAAVGCACGHKGAFVKAAKKLGYGKPWTSTPPSEDLRTRLTELLKQLPTYPHSTLDAKMMEKLRKKQSTRMLKCECDGCGYVVRTTGKWLAEKGAPICPCNNQPMAFDAPEEEDELADAA